MKTNIKILWNNRSTWRNAFDYWYILMFPHLYYTKFVCENNLIDVEEDAWWFYEALNNFNNLFDEDYE
jgi:hypothetical protein